MKEKLQPESSDHLYPSHIDIRLLLDVEYLGHPFQLDGDMRKKKETAAVVLRDETQSLQHSSKGEISTHKEKRMMEGQRETNTEGGRGRDGSSHDDDNNKKAIL